ncbi:MAG: hypothetical protein HY716_18310 [Planctomycetes bacterium]|nr:hypothetical protein [Planctomycetota bacterium]
MARMVKCPRCTLHIDASGVEPGGLLRCPKCSNEMRTSDSDQKPRSAIGQKKGSAKDSEGGASKRQTMLFRKMAGARVPGMTGNRPPRGGYDRAGKEAPKSSMSGVVLWTAAGIVLLIGGAIGIVLIANQGEPQKAARGKTKASRPAAAAPAPPPESEPPSRPRRDEPQLQKLDGNYVAPNTWERGARVWVTPPGFATLDVDEATNQEALGMLAAEQYDRINENPYRYMPAVINALLDDGESVARHALRMMHAFCAAHGIVAEVSGENPIRLDLANSAQFRGGAFSQWAEWWLRNSGNVKGAPAGAAAASRVDVDTLNWDWLASRLKGGGAFFDSTTPQGQAFAQIKAAGKAAYPKLAHYLDNEDLGLAQAVAAALNELTGQNKPLPRLDTQAQVKAEWLDWISKN